MSTGNWTHQEGSEGEDELRAAAVRLSDGFTVVAGYVRGGWADSVEDVDEDQKIWAALGLDFTGEVLWRWQNSSENARDINGVAVGDDGSSVLVGSTLFSYTNLAAINLNETGHTQWVWQDGSADGNDAAHAVVMDEDGSVVLAGVVEGTEWKYEIEGESDFMACKLSANGTVEWTWQDGTDEEDKFSAAAMLEDGSVVLAGQTFGDWGAESAGGSDFAAVMLDSSGIEVWRWQGGTTGEDDFEGAEVDQDGSVVIAGWTTGNWSGETKGEEDFAAVKLDSNGEVVWKWQGGTEAVDVLFAAAMSDDGQAVLSGYTHGDWEGLNGGDRDAAAVKLTADGSTLWRLQMGTSGEDTFEGMAAGPSGSVILAGNTDGTFPGQVSDGSNDLLVVMVPGDTVVTPAPTPAPATASPASVPLATPAPVSRSPVQVPVVAPAPVTASPVQVPVVNPAPVTAFPVQVPVATASPADRPVLEPEGSTSSINTPMIVGTVSGSVAAILLAAAVCLVKKRKKGSSPGDQPSSEGVSDFPLAPSRNNTTESLGENAPPIYDPGEVEPRAMPRTSVRATGHQQSAMSENAIRMSAAEKISTSGRGSETSSSGQQVTLENSAKNTTGGLSSMSGLEATSSTAGVSTSDKVSPPSVVATSSTAGVSTSDNASAPSVVVTSSTAGVSASDIAGAPSVCLEDDVRGSESGFPSTKSGSQAPSTTISVAQAVLQSAKQIASSCQIPGISEAATMVSILIQLVSDNRESTGRCDREVKRCRSIVVMLQRAEDVLGNTFTEGGDVSRQAERVLLEDVKDAIGDLVEIIKTYKSKNKISKVLTSSLFRQRQDEAEAMIDRAIARLHLGIQVRVGHNLNEVRDKLHEVGKDVKDGQEHQRRQSEISASESVAESLAEARRVRRKRKLERLEIPEDHLILTSEQLGRGSFGVVYMADYNGRNAAAKVVLVDHEIGGPRDVDGDDHIREGSNPLSPTRLSQRGEDQRKAFLRELEAMVRLRSPHTVNIYGAITSRSDRLVLVMELLVGGDLRSFLRNRDGLLPEAFARRIIGDVCAGVAFLHGKDTVHGDLKSANVLLDGAGRAKIADFGTSRWAQHTNSTGLATYSTRGNQMTFAWAAPEVLDSKGTSFASDVYSLGVVMWEILTTDVPWGGECLGRDIYLRVVVKGDRPKIPASTPADIADVVRACWAQAKEDRPEASDVLSRMRSQRVEE